MSECLLQTLSTLGTLSLENFYNVFGVLFPLPHIKEEEADLKKARNQLIRLLSALGHCEFDFETRKVSVCQPCIVSLPGRGLAKAVLTGARSPRLIKTLRAQVADNKDAFSLSEKNQTVFSPFLGRDDVSSLELPSCIVIEASDLNLLKEFAQAAGVFSRLGTPAAWSLITFCAGFSDIEGSLSYDGFRDLNWPRHVFDPDTLTFIRSTTRLPTEGLIAYKNPLDGQLRHIFRDGDSEAVIDRDWGRYLVLANNERQVIFYDERRQMLIVPSSVPLPRLLARGATLCSGLAPLQGRLTGGTGGELRHGTPVDIYRAIPYSIARRLADKLSQGLHRLEERHVEVSN